MEKFVNLKEYPIKPVLNILLSDKTLKQNIVFATDSYSHLGECFKESCHIDSDQLLGMDAMEIQPRVLKDAAERASRTKKNAEVMTPAWVVNKMNNHCDEDWFGRPDVFNKEDGKRWVTNAEQITFPANKTWQQYVDSMRLEITCGEAPYIVSRYDTTTGDSIPVKDRIGFLDRKLRVIAENTSNKEEWLKWVTRAFQSVYGYEYQGDNLLIGRINLLITFVDYWEDKWGDRPDNTNLRIIANIIAWNIWQMDGLTGNVPFAYREAKYQQMTMFDLMDGVERKVEHEPIPCKIYDWRSKESVEYNKQKERD